MRNTIMIIQAAVSAALAWAADRLGILYPVLLVLLGMMILDYITGMGASKREAIDHPEDPAYGWNSKKGLKGILKKVGYLCVIAVAMVVDYLIANIAGQLGIQTITTTFFGLLVAVWYILNELLSIIENAGRMGTQIPEWLRKYIAILKQQIDEGNGGDLNGNG
ncbi:MAG TPA: phage holin family protein [Candidatus Avilachnospira avicola]|nr:phage holin family protein [Candidatus Avilachnospira avicola]